MSVAVGKASYMEKQDFDPPYDAEDKRIEASAPVGILYIAYQGQLAGKVYVQYTIDSEFEKILEQLYKTGMCVGIKSFDPNIDDGSSREEGQGDEIPGQGHPLKDRRGYSAHL